MDDAGGRGARRAQSLWSMFARAARSHAQAPAVRDPQRAYTYAEAYRRCVGVAHALRASGVARGDPVLVSTERTVEGVIAILGVAAAGAVPVPVEPDSPRPRLARIIAVSRARTALADDLGLAALTPGDLSTVRLADVPPSSDAAAPSGPPYAADPHRLAYVLFTSGSTGVPKGVEVTDANMRALLAGAQSWDRSTAADVWACYHAFTFDISMWEMWRPLTVGAEVFVMPRLAQLDGDFAYSLLREQGITVLCQTPTAARLLANRVAAGGLPHGLRRLLLAGERLDFAVLEPFSAAVAVGHLEVWNLYGPTEATIYATGYQMTADDIAGERRSLIGDALPHVEADVHEPDADGVGELWISGAGVAAGYRGDPELTRDRFVTDGLGRRAYRTGDRVRRVEDRKLEFLGRSGGFLKVRGYRIEPGEIVAALCAHPAVEEAAVVVADLPAIGPTLVGVVVSRCDVIVTDVDLRRHAVALLPVYMRPGRIIFLDALPRLPSAKLDETALRARVVEGVV